MKILIVTATKEELRPLLEKMQLPVTGGNYFSGQFSGHEVNVLITGVGMVATAYYCAKAIDETIDLAINAGVAGSFNSNLEPGSVVQVYDDMFSEMGAEDDQQFLSLEDLRLPGISRIRNERTVFGNEVLEAIPKVSGITVNTVHGNEASIKAVYDRLHPFVETMEGAAFMMACELEQVPYVQLRAISNFVEKRNRETWNLPLAITNLNDTLMKVLSSFHA